MVSTNKEIITGAKRREKRKPVIPIGRFKYYARDMIFYGVS